MSKITKNETQVRKLKEDAPHKLFLSYKPGWEYNRNILSPSRDNPGEIRCNGDSSTCGKPRLFIQVLRSMAVQSIGRQAPRRCSLLHTTGYVMTSWVRTAACPATPPSRVR